MAVAPVIAFPGEKPDDVAIAADLQPVTVMLDFVHPLRAGGRFEGAGRNAGSDEGGARTNLGHPLSYRVLRPPGKYQSVAELSPGRTPMPGRRVQIDDATWHALSQLAKDRMQDFQERADEAFADLLAKHGRPADLKTALRQSVADMDKRPPATSVKRGGGKKTASNDNG
jgi:hypothetical protein